MQVGSNDILWTAGFFNERFPAPVSPLAWSLLGPLIETLALRDPLRYLGYPHAETIPLTRLWHGHPYTNALAFHMFYKPFPDFFVPEDAYRYFPDGDTRARRLVPYPSSIWSPRLIGSLARAALRDLGNWLPFTNYRTWARYTGEHDRRVTAINAQLDAFATAEPWEIFAALDAAKVTHRDLLRIHRWSLLHADLTFGLLRRLARAWIDQEHGGEIAGRGVVDTVNKTLQVDRALRELACMAGDALQGGPTVEEFVARLSPEARVAWADLLATHGHRSFSLDISVPSFAEEPGQIIRLLRAIDLGESKPEVAGNAPVAPSGVVRRRIYSAVRHLATQYVVLREDQRYYWQKSLAVSRRLYLLLGDWLVRDGVMAERTQVFYAVHGELVNFFKAPLSKPELSAVIAQREAEWDGYRREYAKSPAASYPLFLRGDVPLGSAVAHRQVWQARAVSPGTARGTARVIQSALDLGRVTRGDILVAPSTDPAWTPVFSRIAGLVLERGGVLSHGAVVAREYRVPAVAGIANIATEIADGEWIEVNGSTGVITRLE